MLFLQLGTLFLRPQWKHTFPMILTRSILSYVPAAPVHPLYRLPLVPVPGTIPVGAPRGRLLGDVAIAATCVPPEWNRYLKESWDCLVI